MQEHNKCVLILFRLYRQRCIEITHNSFKKMNYNGKKFKF